MKSNFIKLITIFYLFFGNSFAENILIEAKKISLDKKNRVLKVFKNANKKLLIIKNGDHSLSTKRNLNKITTELDNIAFNSI